MSKKKKKLTRRKIEEWKDERRRISTEKYKLGRMVVQIKDYHGLPAGRLGWVMDTWPKTRILFEDGRESSMSSDLCPVLEATDMYEDDLDTLRDEIMRVSGRTPRKIKRKPQY